MRHQRLLIQIEGAILAAFAVALEYVPHTVGPSAIEVSFGIIPIIIYSVRRGVVPGMISAFIWGTLDLILRGLSSGSVLNVWQGLFEFTVAFIVVGLAGVCQHGVQQSIRAHQPLKTNVLLWLAVLIGTLTKYTCHFIAGVVYWGAYAPKGMNAWLYSLVINGGSFLATFILTGIVASILYAMLPSIYLPKDMQFKQDPVKS